MKKLHGRHILISGAGRGIGAASAELLADLGADLSFIGRTPGQIEEMASKLKAKHPKQKFFGYLGDISNEVDVVGWVHEAESKVGKITDLLNNAAQFFSGDLISTKTEDWDRLFAVNVRGVFLSSREVAKRMILTGSKGSILTIGSLAGIRGVQKFAGMSAYSATKSALVGLTEVLAEELKSHHIRVNLLAPGAVNTEMLRTAFPDFKAAAQPQDLAEIVAFLLDPHSARVVTGSIIEVNTNP